MVKVFFFQTQFRISWKDFGSLEMSNDANLKKTNKKGSLFYENSRGDSGIFRKLSKKGGGGEKLLFFLGDSAPVGAHKPLGTIDFTGGLNSIAPLNMPQNGEKRDGEIFTSL